MARSHIPYWYITPPTFTDFVPPSYPVKLHSDSATDLTGYQSASTASAKPLRSVFALPVAEAVLPAAAPLTTAGCRTPPFLVPNRSDISPYAHPVHPAAPTGAVAGSVPCVAIQCLCGQGAQLPLLTPLRVQRPDLRIIRPQGIKLA